MAGFLASASAALGACGGGAAPGRPSAGGDLANASRRGATASEAVAAQPTAGGTLNTLIPSMIAAIHPVHEADWNSDAATCNLQPTWLLICQIIQQELKQVGVGVQIQQADWTLFLDNMPGRRDIAYGSLGGTNERHRDGDGGCKRGATSPTGRSAGRASARVAYTDNLVSTRYWNVSQITRNPALAGLSQRIAPIVGAARSEIDSSRRHALMSQFQRLVVDQLPAIPLWHSRSTSVMQPWVHGPEAPSEHAIAGGEGLDRAPLRT